MRHTLLLFTISLLILSCSKSVFDSEQRIAPDSLDDIDYTVGLTAVNKMFCAGQGDEDAREVLPYAVGKDTVFYVINYETGWKVIANDQRVQPIVAQDETGRLDMSDIGNAGVELWLELAADNIKNYNRPASCDEAAENILFWEQLPEIKIKNALKAPKTKDVIDSLSGASYAWARELVSESSYITTNNVNPLTETFWGQFWPWNTSLTFNFEQGGQEYSFPTGCVPVAIAQLFYFLHFSIGKPSGLYYNFYLTGYTQNGPYYYFSFIPANYDNPSSRWNSMALWAYGLEEPTTGTEYVSELMKYIGNVLGVGYSVGSAGVPSINSSIFTSNGLSYSSSAYNVVTVENNIRSGQPVMIIGDSPSGNRHCWLINGIIQRTTHSAKTYRWYRLPDGTYSAPPAGTNYYTEVEAYLIDPALYDGKIQNVSTSDTSKYWKMNWGADGSYDGGEYGIYATWSPGNQGPFSQNLLIYYNFQ